MVRTRVGRVLAEPAAVYEGTIGAVAAASVEPVADRAVVPCLLLGPRGHLEEPRTTFRGEFLLDCLDVIVYSQLFRAP